LEEVNVPPETEETTVRAAALAWLQERTLGGTLELSREQLANDFYVAGARFPLVDRGRGIRKPAGWRAALSIMTAAPKSGRARPYEDVEGIDGLHRYKLRRDQGGSAENESLRVALREQTPLIWFYGIEAGVFNVISPVWLVAEEPDNDQFVLALTESQRIIEPESAVEEALRRYLISETKRRLHQPVFANQVIRAYSTRCAVCDLNYRQLLDAAHIIPDKLDHGIPVVSNGLALCKIHHAANDRNVLGIRPDYIVEIHEKLLYEEDGPMLTHGLQEHHGQRLMRLPTRISDHPDPIRLEERYEEFRAA
jgi:putative restriction endonuclease